MPLSWHLKKNKVGWEKSVDMIILLEGGKEVKIKPIDFRLKLVFIGDLIMAISDVQDSGSWYYILDSNGKKSAILSKSSVGTFLGIVIDFIVTQNGSWYYTYDEKGKKIATISGRRQGLEGFYGRLSLFPNSFGKPHRYPDRPSTCNRH